MKYLILISQLLYFSACSGQLLNKKDWFTLTGIIKGSDTGIIVLWHPDTLGKWIKDTCILIKGKFRFGGPIHTPSYVHLISSTIDGNYASFFLEKGKQSIILKKNNFDYYQMRGSETQKETEPLRKKITTLEKKKSQLTSIYESKKDSSAQSRKKLENQIQLINEKEKTIRIAFIKKNPNSYASPTELLGLINFISFDMSNSLLNAFSPKIKESSTALLCKKEIDKKKQLISGVFLPDFIEKDIKGENISLSHFIGKYVLLDFWASWCIPCRKEIPHLKEVYLKYQKKGFEIIAISNDNDKIKWENAVQNEAIKNWVNIIESNQIKSIFQGVTVLPTQILLDPEGKIIWSSIEDNHHSWEDILARELQ
ncbi:MAG TPA: TlpA disulfide reductase family protein [Chitinophagaceae bacterium]|nr:TlpA disulfide reductase family protein [Chitinophagaceae bacterium]